MPKLSLSNTAKIQSVWVNFILKALESNKHVFSEKPHGGTVCELKSVLDLAKEKNLQWIDGTMVRWNRFGLRQ